MKLSIFVPVHVVNPMNGPHHHWSIPAKRASEQKRMTAMLCHELGQPRFDPQTPKVVRFVAHTWNALDDDNCAAALKHFRDGLIAGGVIHDDSKRSGHLFVYDQVIDRRSRGVAITAEPL